MYNEVDIARVETCLEHIEAIETYTRNILVPEDFLKPVNHVTFDGSLMRLQALGEVLKSLTGKNPEFEKDLSYGQLKNVIRFRDLLSHHYDRVGHVDILHLIRVHLPELKNKLIEFKSKQTSK